MPTRPRPAAVQTVTGLPRLAWFSPVPPSPSGIAAYTAEILPHLASSYEIDVYVENPTSARPLAGGRVRDAHDFVWQQAVRPYTLAVYHIGNAACHDYIWPYMVRWPGLVVLHDGQIHQARARALLAQWHERPDDYRAEFAFSHPDVKPELAELGIAGLFGSLHYLWPMQGVPLAAARLVAVHNAWLAEDLREQSRTTPVETISMGVAAHRAAEEAGRQVRDRYGLPAGGTLFAAFGAVTPEKRTAQILRALAAVTRDQPDARLLLVGAPAAHYDAAAETQALGIADRVTSTGFVDDDHLGACLAAADVCLCLRWPTTHETSASWLRCLAAGKATIVTDLPHQVDVPSLDPRSWQLLRSAAAAGSPSADDTAATPAASRPHDAVSVSIDILDELHSLQIAMRRLALDPVLRERLGTRARSHWQRHHTLERMAADYRRVIRAAIGAGDPRAREPYRRLPPHLLDDHTGALRRWLADVGLSGPRLADPWS